MEHEVIPAGEIHAPHNWRVADEAARLALTVVEGDLGKYLWQQDDDTEWFLIAHAPATWKQHIGPQGPQGATGATGAQGAPGADGNAADTAAVIHAATSKTTPVDADELGISDSADSWLLKKLTWANLKVTLLAYFKGQFREKLTAARTYYVRTDGSDSNDGLANTSGGAFLTIQKAIDTAAALDNGGFNITIQVAAGTFVANNILKSFVGSGVITITGAGDTTVIAPNTVGTCFGDTSTSGGWLGTYDITSMKLAPTVNDCMGLGSIWGSGGILFFGNINFGAFGTGGGHISVGRGALVSNDNRNYTISGGGNSHLSAYDGGQIRTQSSSITLVGTPAFSNFAVASRGGTVLANANTYSGGATGTRYTANLGGGVLTSGGATYLPGDATGTATSPGWYA